MAEPSPVSFAEKVYALSKVIQIVKFQNSAAGTYNDHQRRHLHLLDDIALLLVTESSSDEAAVAFERRKAEVVFYYAKNRPCTDAEDSHIKALTAIVKAENRTADDRLRAMLAKLLDICGPKILSRLGKLKLAISETPVDKWHVHEDPEDAVHQYFKERLGGWYNESPGATMFLQDFMSHLNSLNVKQCKHGPLLILIELAHITGSFKPVTALFPNPEVGKRMRLLGDYFGAVTRIVKYYDSIRPNSSIPVEITFIEAPVPEVDKISLPADFLVILNQCASENRLPQVDYTSLTKVYPPRTPFDVDDKSFHPVKQSVHAECTLAVYLKKLGRTWKHVEIGCSKGSCWLCEMYLARYCSVLKFHVSYVHGKLQPGWKIPVGGNQVSNQRILDLVDDKVLEVLHRTHNSMQRNSEPRSGSDSESKKVTAKPAAKPAWFNP